VVVGVVVVVDVVTSVVVVVVDVGLVGQGPPQASTGVE
jgi:hypothetical protein